MDDNPKPARRMPKGGRKGGTIFPRLSLTEALKYAKKLVSKTHTGAQSTESIYAGVVNAKSGLGATRVSALRQFALLEGKRDNLSATDLARRIMAAPEEEKPRLLRRACLNPKIFRELFETFHGDGVTKAKLRQRVSALKVHPDELDSCVDAFLDSVQISGLGKVSGDQVMLVGKADIEAAADPKSESLDAAITDVDDTELANGDVEAAPPAIDVLAPIPQSVGTASQAKAKAGEPLSTEPDVVQASGKPNVTVSINIDSTMDPEKLAKQLELLKKFGAI